MPSVDLGVFSISYELVLKELTVPGILCSHVGRPNAECEENVWVSKKVDVTASFGKGPRPVAYAPESYSRAYRTDIPRNTSSTQLGASESLYGVGRELRC